jgi:hypothetical protein
MFILFLKSIFHKLFFNIRMHYHAPKPLFAVILHLPEISRNVRNKKREYLKGKNIEHETA